MSAIASQLLGDALETLQRYRELGERAMAQLSDEQLLLPLDPGSNSVATLVKHLHGTARSRWRDFLVSDGEKPDRDRDAEFLVAPDTSRDQVESWWTEGWGHVEDALAALRPTDLERTVTIAGQPCSVLQAVNRHLTHVAYHVGQMVLLARHLRGAEWRPLDGWGGAPPGGGGGADR